MNKGKGEEVKGFRAQVILVAESRLWAVKFIEVVGS
jgi:hypothetical protein